MANHKRIFIFKILKDERFQKLLISFFTFISLFICASIGVIPQKYNLKVGDISPADIKAPRDFVDQIETQNRINSALSNVEPQYNKNNEIEEEAVENIQRFFNKVSEIKKLNIDVEEKIIKLNNPVIIKLSREDYKGILSLRDDEISELSEYLVQVIGNILSQEIRENNSEDLKKAQSDVEFFFKNSTMSKQMKDIGINIGYILIKPNAFFDKEKTQEAKIKIKREIDPVVIKKNQNIIQKGEVVNEKHISLMRRAGILTEDAGMDIAIYSGIAVIIIILQIVIGMALYKFRRDIFNSNSKLFMIAITLCINSYLSLGINLISQYLTCVNFMVFLLALIFDPLLSLSISIPTTIFIALITNLNLEVCLLYIVGSIAAVLLLNNVVQRHTILWGGLVIGILNAALTFSFGLINAIDLFQNLTNSLVGILTGILSAILAIGILPIFEQMFDIITPIKLLELSNPNQPLLKKMLFEAPGTYHHSIIVGNLAETAADEIKANSLLARVGAYYHDIGKIKRPYFFKENQITNDNPHDKITPKLSTLIITSHVKDGVELANQYKLPSVIRDIIEQHHGTTLVRYFYVQAKNEVDHVLEEEAFRYDAPKPKSKEAAIVMLADSVEAAVRSISNPTVAEIENMVNKIIDEKVNDSQLNNAEITLKEIEKIKESFIKVLVGIFHNRIEYPELNNQNV